MRSTRGIWGIAALLLVAACGGGDDTVTSATDPTGVTSTSAAEAPEDWCDELAALERAEDKDRLTSKDIAGAPEVIRAPLETIVVLGEMDPTSAPPGSDEEGVRAVAEVESWSHQHCGGDHPFCSLWISVNGAMATPAFVEEAKQDEAFAELVSLLEELHDVLLEVAPAEVRDDVEAVLAAYSAVDDAGTISEEDERLAESAETGLDEWLWSEGCEGATEPDDE
jgi:hypothetical protein